MNSFLTEEKMEEINEKMMLVALAAKKSKVVSATLFYDLQEKAEIVTVEDAVDDISTFLLDIYEMALTKGIY